MRVNYKNYFWLICTSDALELPICYCETYAEVCHFFDKKQKQMSESILKHYKGGCLYIKVSGSSKRYKVVRCRDNNGNIEVYERFATS